MINHLRTCIMTLLFALPCMLYAFHQADTIIDRYKSDSLHFAIKADSIIAFQKGENVFTVIKADTIISSQPKEVLRTRYDRRVNRIRKKWNKLIPEYGKIQYAGNMGFLSFGTGWDYGKHKQWETDLLLGFLPKYNSKNAKITMTLKQNYLPWSFYLGKGFSTEPLSCGIYINTVFGDQFWMSEPDRYPKGYYGFSSKLRFHVFLGQRLSFELDPQQRFWAKSVTLFYELSTCDFFLISALQNSYLRPRDYLSLSFGIKFQWL